MTDLTLYHNPRCSKSRSALALLTERGLQPTLIYYLDTPPSANELRELLHKLGYNARQLLRTGEELYQTLNLADAHLSEAALIDVMRENPRLIERPILIVGERAIVGRPPENILELLP